MLLAVFCAQFDALAAKAVKALSFSLDTYSFALSLTFASVTSVSPTEFLKNGFHASFNVWETAPPSLLTVAENIL